VRNNLEHHTYRISFAGEKATTTAATATTTTTNIIIIIITTLLLLFITIIPLYFEFIHHAYFSKDRHQGLQYSDALYIQFSGQWPRSVVQISSEISTCS
jgi:hypothetical protein